MVEVLKHTTMAYHQGSIITRWRDNFHIDELGSKVSGSGSWFLVETNYDQWNAPPFYDDRRSPAVQCLNEAGQGNASLSLLYNVLSTRPVMNKVCEVFLVTVSNVLFYNYH